MSDEPKFLLGNYVDRYCEMAVTSGSGVADVFNGDREVGWTSSGETSEAGYDVYVECIFKNSAGTNITRDIDAICIRNTNIKKFRLRYSATAAGAYSTITTIVYNGTSDADGLVLTNADDDLYITFSELTAGKIRVEIESTIVANEEKTIGELLAMHTNYSATDNATSLNQKVIDKKGEYRLESGVLKSWFNYRKYECKLIFSLANETMMENLRDIKMNNESFCIYPEPDSRKGDIWMVRWSNDWLELYTVNYKGAGYTIKIEMDGV